MDENEWLADQFESYRSRLRAVAYRMLGSQSEADDAVQISWLRLSRSDPDSIENMGGWLTTVVARVCLDMLRARKSRREESLEAHGPEQFKSREKTLEPEQEALLADSVGLALLVVLDTLEPAERLAFVLHDMFDVPFDEIAPIVDRTPTAARKLASRARHRVRVARADPEGDLGRQREVVDAFLAAARSGNFEALLALLDPEVVLQADDGAVRFGAPDELRGAQAVAEHFSGRMRNAKPALINGAPGAAWGPGARPRAVCAFRIRGGRILAIDLLADAEGLDRLDVVILGA
ncbi:MAG TPA: sigma-70 family RNA polymerase sigma factor [Candidatus Binatia bacterium]|nr:sigma-70 family RNA polymerase sigma factor [Candidatus Binatia bacterium]